jgi:hypothetical protein
VGVIERRWLFPVRTTSNPRTRASPAQNATSAKVGAGDEFVVRFLQDAQAR